jgi:hypothetical protein
MASSSGAVPARSGGQAPPPLPTSARPSTGRRPPNVPSAPRPTSASFGSAPPVPNTSRPTGKASTLPAGTTLSATPGQRPRGMSDSKPSDSGAYGRVNMGASSPAQASPAVAASAAIPTSVPTATTGGAYGAVVHRTGDGTAPPSRPAAAPTPAPSAATAGPYGQVVPGRGPSAPVAHDPEGDYCDIREEMPARPPATTPVAVPKARGSRAYEGLAAREQLPGSYEDVVDDALPPNPSVNRESVYMNMLGDQPLVCSCCFC